MSQIVSMGVDDVYFLVQRLGADCDDYQQYRELTQNAIDAVIRARAAKLLPPEKGEVIWDVDWLALAETGTYRACVSDNGDGMSSDELSQYINRLSSSRGIQSLVQNYGIGAKIAAATRNPAGLVYQSWRGGAGILAQLVVDHQQRAVGLHRFEVEDGLWQEILDNIDPENRPTPIVDHGVSVSLLGTHERDHTFLGPDRLATAYKTWWLFRTLNRRYFRLPVTVKVRVFHTWDPESWPKTKADAEASDASLMRTVFGQQHYLEKYALDFGTVRLSGGTAHFYVMDPERGKDQRQFFEPAGHIAALYQNELLEMRTGNAGRKLLQNFGAVFSSGRLVVYVEPDADLGQITTNTARNELIVDGKQLPWMDWADEFRQNLPQAIADLEHEIASHGTSNSHNETIRDRLKKIRDLYKVTRYRPGPTGIFDADIQTVGNAPRRTRATRSSTGSTTHGGAGGRAGSEYLAARRSGGQNSHPVDTHSVEPNTDWVSLHDTTRQQGDMEDRAARYLRPQHQILINADFRVFTDMIDHFKEMFGIPGALDTITDVVHEWFEQLLIEAVMGVRGIEGSKLWDQDKIDAALNEEALTAVVMPRYHTWFSIKRELSRKFGSASQDVAVAGKSRPR